MNPYIVMPLITGLVLIPFATGCGIKQTTGMILHLLALLACFASLALLASILIKSTL